MVPQMVARFPGVAYLRLLQPKAARTLSLAWRRKAPLSSAASALKGTILKVLAQV